MSPEHEALLRDLHRLDDSFEVRLTQWECNFVESCFKAEHEKRPLSPRQVETAEKLFDQYEGKF